VKSVLVIVLLLLSPGLQAQPAPVHHGLIVGIGAYRDGEVGGLPGMEHDIANAQKIAGFMGISRERAVVLQDRAAVAERVRSELKRIAAEVKREEHVFVYFSGHGSRWRDPDNTARCNESLVFWDQEHITKEELGALLKPIAEKADKLVLFLDSCHSGGLVTRAAAPRRPGGFVPKFHRDSRTRDSCEVAVNDLADAVSPVPPKTRGAGRPSNVVLIAAARENEYALHREDIGGLATHAWSQCALGKARDEDRSGAVSFAEVEACAQREINQELAPVREYAPHHITTAGTRGLPLAFLLSAYKAYSTAKTVIEIAQHPAVQQVIAPITSIVMPAEPAKPQPPAPPLTTNVVTAPVPVSQPAAPAPEPVAEIKPLGPVGTLNDIAAVADGRWEFEAVPAKTSLKIGQDFLDFRVRSQQGGFVYVLAVGSDNKTVDVLFPNKLDSQNVIKGGEEMQLPRANWRLRANGPVGTNHLLVVVSETERNFAELSLESLAGVFQSAKAERAGALQGALYEAKANESCKGLNTRNLVVQTACTGRYAATILKIDEVN
jgi:hypothetical protein